MIRSPQEKFLLLFEAAKRSLLAAKLLRNRIGRELEELEVDIDMKSEIGGRASIPLISAVAFVDFSHRFGSIVDSLPLINKRSPEIRKLRSTLEPVEQARNHLQHMRGDLSSNLAIDYPLLGSISWATGNASYTIFLSQPTQIESVSLPYDTQENRWPIQLQYTIKNIALDLDKILSEMEISYNWIVSSVPILESGQTKLDWGGTNAFGFHVHLVQK